MNDNSFEIFKGRMKNSGLRRNEREINRLKNKIVRYRYDSPSLKKVQLNGKNKEMFIDSTSDYDVYTIKSIPNDIFYAGDILTWEDYKWLITESVVENNIYTKGKINKCTYELKWIDDGKIKKQPCVIKSGTSETEQGLFIVVGIDKVICLLSFNEYTTKIKKGMRFFIDNDLKSPTPYKVVGVENVANVGNGHGYITLTLDEDVLLKEDNIELLICNYYDKKQEEVNKNGKYAKITKSIDGIILGYDDGTLFSVEFINDGLVINDIIPKWDIQSSIKEDLKIIENENGVLISATKESSLGNTVKITVSDSNNEFAPDEVIVKVVSIY